jgi:hypothetical protein
VFQSREYCVSCDATSTVPAEAASHRLALPRTQVGKAPPDMDPISGLSFACNVLDMVDRAITYGKTIKEIYDSSTGLSSSNEDLDGVTRSMVAITEDLQNLQGEITQSKPDPHMQEVTEECSAVCIAIQIILAKCKPKRERSVLSAASASIRSLLNKSDLDKFQAKLDKSLQSLNSLVSTKTLYVEKFPLSHWLIR